MGVGRAVSGHRVPAASRAGVAGAGWTPLSNTRSGEKSNRGIGVAAVNWDISDDTSVAAEVFLSAWTSVTARKRVGV